MCCPNLTETPIPVIGGHVKAKAAATRPREGVNPLGDRVSMKSAGPKDAQDEEHQRARRHFMLRHIYIRGIMSMPKPNCQAPNSATHVSEESICGCIERYRTGFDAQNVAHSDGRRGPLHFTFSTTSVWSSNSTRLKRSRSAKMVSISACADTWQFARTTSARRQRPYSSPPGLRWSGMPSE